MQKELTEYDIQANNFLEATNTVINKEYIGTYNRNDFGVRDNYKITITRGSRSINFEFSQSLQNSGRYHIVRNKKSMYKDILAISQSDTLYGVRSANTLFVVEAKYSKDDILRNINDTVLDIVLNENRGAPSNYDILACLQKYPVDSLENFCSDFGYDTDSIKANSLYLAVQKEYMQVASIWNDSELEQLQEIN